MADQAAYLMRLVAQLDDRATDPNTAAYLGLLDRALEDRILTQAEAEVLAATAEEWGLAPSVIEQAHQDYVRTLVAAAKADGVVTTAERVDVERVSALLGLPISLLDRELAQRHRPVPTAAAPTLDSLVGLSVCFTGTLRSTLDGRQITRAVAQRLAAEAGLEVRASVTRDLDLLVVADPDTLSGKAVKARQRGTRIISEAAFWPLINIAVG
ncbi:MAG: hypothetical protein H6512_14210 [Acidimicrobiia bacterium]|nr:hypothetical protein [Acidimicrobiia bacterium]